MQWQQQVVVVDPGACEPVLAWLKANQLPCHGVWITHHHADHTAGLPGILAAYPKAHVVGPQTIQHLVQPHRFTNASATTRIAARGDMPGWRILHCPGHTMDHVCFYTPGYLFSGDTLFKAGCGRRFEGSVTDLYTSLQSLLMLPNDTQVYPAHEYTLANLRFAKHYDPNNRMVREHLDRDTAKRQNDQCTLPTTMAIERSINPFFRLREPCIRNALQLDTHASDHEAFARLRSAKDHFS